MRGISLVVALMIALVVCVAEVTPTHQGEVKSQAQAIDIIPFVSGWAPFDREVEVDEPTPVGALEPTLRGERYRTWGEETKVAPFVPIGHPDLGEVWLSGSFRTPKSRAIRQVWWTTDPTISPHDKKRWNRLDRETSVERGLWWFRCKPELGLNEVRVLAEIAEAKESSSRPFPGVKMGSYKAQERGMTIRFTGVSILDERKQIMPRLLESGIISRRQLNRLLEDMGAGGRSTNANDLHGDEPLENGHRDLRNVPDSEVPDASEEEPEQSGNGCGAPRWVAVEPIGFATSPTMKLRWSDGTESEAFVAGKDRVRIPSEVTGFQAYLLVNKEWKRNWLIKDGRRSDALYPVPNPGGTITIRVRELAR